jgi:putative tryptophan/tyrosine transport system substrate-binding protein
LLAAIRKIKPDLIYSWGTPTTLLIAGTTKKPIIQDVPIIFTTVAEPVKSELVE